MCGICGFAGNGSVDDLRRMNGRLIHRGPDGSGEFIDHENKVHFAHRRLSIIDIKSGDQPMISGDGKLIVIFNGEIYNHIELRKELIAKGHSFRSSHSDTEVLLYAYREWGDRFVQRLNGMWALAIYDSEHGKIFLSRDRFGKKPLFYTLQNGVFAFASELSALGMHSNVVSNLDSMSLKKYYAYGYIPAPRSIYKGVFKLPGGHSLVYDCRSSQIAVHKYWEFKLEPEGSVVKKENDLCEQLRDIFNQSVKRRLMSDVPLGIFLSGGVDSSAVAYFARKNQTGNSVKTFSVEFEEESFDESYYSRMASSYLGTDHYAQKLTIQSALEVIPEIRSRIDEPMGDSSLIATYLLCKETVKHVKVALGGDGADELFAGYDPFQAIKYAELYGKIVPRPVHEAIRMLVALMPVSHTNMSLDFKLKRTLRGLSYNHRFWNSIWLGPLPPDEIEILFQEKIDLDSLYSEAIDSWEKCDQKNLIDKTLQFYTELYLQDDILVKVDRAGMMNSLEVRSPFLDIEMVDFARKLPNIYKFRQGKGKYLLKKALSNIIPAEIINRRKKGFGVPLGKWFLDGDLRINNADSSVLDNKYIDIEYQLHRSGQKDNRAFLWNHFISEPFLS